MEHCAPNRVLLHSADNHHYTYQQPPTPHILIPHNGQAKTIALCLLPPTFATATPFGQKPCATTCISNSTHEESKLYTRRNQAPHTKKPFEPYRTNLFRKQIYVQKFGHKNHIRKPSVATRKGPGRLSSSNRGPSYKISIEHFR